MFSVFLEVNLVKINPGLVFFGSFKVLFYFLFQLARDLLHPTAAEEKRRHKLKRLVQSPNSYFMDVKCPGWWCYLLER